MLKRRNPVVLTVVTSVLGLNEDEDVQRVSRYGSAADTITRESTVWEERIDQKGGAGGERGMGQ